MHVQVEGLHALNGLSCGGLHGLAQQQTGQLLAWGANQNGVLGLGSELIQSQRGPMPLQKTFASQVLILCCRWLSPAVSTRLLHHISIVLFKLEPLPATDCNYLQDTYPVETWPPAQMAAALTHALPHTSLNS